MDSTVLTWSLCGDARETESATHTCTHARTILIQGTCVAKMIAADVLAHFFGRSKYRRHSVTAKEANSRRAFLRLCANSINATTFPPYYVVVKGFSNSQQIKWKKDRTTVPFDGLKPQRHGGVTFVDDGGHHHESSGGDDQQYISNGGVCLVNDDVCIARLRNSMPASITLKPMTTTSQPCLRYHCFFALPTGTTP